MIARLTARRPRPEQTRAGRGGVSIAIALASVLAAGCVTSGNMLASRGTGMARCYHLPYETLWPILEEAVQTTGLVLTNSNRESGFLLAESYRPEVQDPEDMALGADQGEAVAIFVEPEGVDVWAVEVVSRAKFGLDLTPMDWTRPLFNTLELTLPTSASSPNADLAACTRVRGLTTPGHVIR